MDITRTTEERKPNKFYFCYELNHNGWHPVVFWNEKPPKSVNGQDRERTVLQDVPDDCINVSGEPMFGRLQARFPKP